MRSIRIQFVAFLLFVYYALATTIAFFQGNLEEEKRYRYCLLIVADVANMLARGDTDREIISRIRGLSRSLFFDLSDTTKIFLILRVISQINGANDTTFHTQQES